MTAGKFCSHACKANLPNAITKFYFTSTTCDTVTLQQPTLLSPAGGNKSCETKG